MYDLSLFYTKKYDPKYTSSFSTAVGHLLPVHGSKSISGSEISPFLIQGNLNLSRMESFSPRHQDLLTQFSFLFLWMDFDLLLGSSNNIHFCFHKAVYFSENCQNLSYTNTPSNIKLSHSPHNFFFINELFFTLT